MTFQFGYLTNKQKRFWGLRRRGLTKSEVSREMKVTRQATNNTFNVIDAKVSKALREAARVHRIDVRELNPVQGFLLGYSQAFNSEVLMTFSESNGINVWYRNDVNCGECGWNRSCKKILLAEAEERDIELPEDKEDMSPTELAEILFTKITGE